MFATEILGAYPLFFASELIERLRYDVLNDKTNGYLGSKLGSQWIKNAELGLKWGGKPETHWNLTYKNNGFKPAQVSSATTLWMSQAMNWRFDPQTMTHYDTEKDFMRRIAKFGIGE